MKKINLIFVIIFIFLNFVYGNAEIKNLTVDQPCYLPGGQINITFEVKASSNKKIYADVLYSDDNSPNYNDDCVLNNKGIQIPPDKNGHTGYMILNNKDNNGEWKQINITVPIPENYYQGFYIIVNVAESQLILKKNTIHIDDSAFVFVNLCSVFTPTPTPTYTPTPILTPTTHKLDLLIKNIGLNPCNENANEFRFLLKIINYDDEDVNINDLSVKMWFYTENLNIESGDCIGGIIYDNNDTVIGNTSCNINIFNNLPYPPIMKIHNRWANRTVEITFQSNIKIPANGGYVESIECALHLEGWYIPFDEGCNDYTKQGNSPYSQNSSIVLYENGIVVIEYKNANEIDKNSGIEPEPESEDTTPTITPTPTMIHCSQDISGVGINCLTPIVYYSFNDTENRLKNEIEGYESLYGIVDPINRSINDLDFTTYPGAISGFESGVKIKVCPSIYRHSDVIMEWKQYVPINEIVSSGVHNHVFYSSNDDSKNNAGQGYRLVVYVTKDNNVSNGVLVAVSYSGYNEVMDMGVGGIEDSGWYTIRLRWKGASKEGENTQGRVMLEVYDSDGNAVGTGRGLYESWNKVMGDTGRAEGIKGLYLGADGIGDYWTVIGGGANYLIGAIDDFKVYKCDTYPPTPTPVVNCLTPIAHYSFNAPNNRLKNMNNYYNNLYGEVEPPKTINDLIFYGEDNIEYRGVGGSSSVSGFFENNVCIKLKPQIIRFNDTIIEWFQRIDVNEINEKNIIFYAVNKKLINANNQIFRILVTVEPDLDITDKKAVKIVAQYIPYDSESVNLSVGCITNNHCIFGDACNNHWFKIKLRWKNAITDPSNSINGFVMLEVNDFYCSSLFCGKLENDVEHYRQSLSYKPIFLGKENGIGKDNQFYDINDFEVFLGGYPYTNPFGNDYVYLKGVIDDFKVYRCDSIPTVTHTSTLTHTPTIPKPTYTPTMNIYPMINAPVNIFNSEYEMVIITADGLVPEFQDLAKWKIKKGMKTGIFTVEWIYQNYESRNPVIGNPGKIRRFLQELYLASINDNKPERLQYVLLGGDVYAGGFRAPERDPYGEKQYIRPMQPYNNNVHITVVPIIYSVYALPNDIYYSMLEPLNEDWVFVHPSEFGEEEYIEDLGMWEYEFNMECTMGRGAFQPKTGDLNAVNFTTYIGRVCATNPEHVEGFCRKSDRSEVLLGVER